MLLQALNKISKTQWTLFMAITLDTHLSLYITGTIFFNTFWRNRTASTVPWLIPFIIIAAWFDLLVLFLIVTIRGCTQAITKSLHPCSVIRACKSRCYRMLFGLSLNSKPERGWMNVTSGTMATVHVGYMTTLATMLASHRSLATIHTSVARSHWSSLHSSERGWMA